MLYNVPVTTISESYPHAISQSANLEALSVPSHSQLNQHLLPLSYWVIIGIESKRDYKYLRFTPKKEVLIIEGVKSLIRMNIG